jgi:hypothetical protein
MARKWLGLMTAAGGLCLLALGTGSASAVPIAIDDGSDDQAKIFVGFECLCGQDRQGFLNITTGSPAPEIGSTSILDPFGRLPGYISGVINLVEPDDLTTRSDSFQILVVDPTKDLSVVLGSDPNVTVDLLRKLVVETGDWQNIGHFFGVDDTFVQIRSDVDSAVPLPAALPLFASGLGGFGLMGWWRRRRIARAN